MPIAQYITTKGALTLAAFGFYQIGLPLFKPVVVRQLDRVAVGGDFLPVNGKEDFPHESHSPSFRAGWLE